MAFRGWLVRHRTASKVLQVIGWAIFGAVLGPAVNSLDTNWKYAYWGFMCGVGVAAVAVHIGERRRERREREDADQRRLARHADGVHQSV